MEQRYIKAAILAIAIVVSGTRPIWGQAGNTAGIYGTVYDPNQAVAPNAQVTLKDTDTGSSQTTSTDGKGTYRFQLLPVGKYQISAEKTGFQTYTQSGITLQVNDNVKADLHLSIGQLTTTVDVSSAGTLVDTQGAQLRTVVDPRRIVDLPLNGRNLADLALLSPGTVPASNTNGTDAQGYGNGVKIAVGSRQFSINGARNNETRYSLDGADNDDPLYNSGMPFPFPDAVQEFSIVTAGKSVDVGSSPGGMVNIITKSGTNQIHGDAFWFVRNTAFDANDFFSQTGDQLKRNQGGFTAGGPAIKDKLFLFGGWQRTWIRQTVGSNLVQAIPAAYRNGDFSNLLSAATSPTGSAIQLVNPTTNQPYPNNQIPRSQFSPAMQKLLTYWPTPDASGLVAAPETQNQDISQYLIRGDYIADEHNTIYMRYLRQDATTPRPLIENNLATSQNGNQLNTQSGTIGWTTTITPNLISDAHGFVNYAPAHRTLDAPWGNITNFGVAINPLANELDIGLSGDSGFGLGSAARAADFRRANLGFSDGWRWAKGRHNLSFGGEVYWTRYNEYNPYHASGVFSFNGNCTGFDQADAITGCLSQFTQGTGEFEFRRNHYQALFVGDTFRITDRVTLDGGLRWEPFTPITDLRNRNLTYSQALYDQGVQSSVWLNSPPGLFYPGDTINGQKISQGVVHPNWNLIAPRIGVAWDVFGDGTTSLRAGAGIYYDQPEIYMLNALSDQAPFGYDENFQGGNFDHPYAGRESANVFPLSPSFASNPNLVFPSPLFAYAQETTYKQATTYTWNFSLERQFAKNWLGRIAYVGNESAHLGYTQELNPSIYNFNESLRDNLQTIQQRRPMQQYERLYILATGQNANYNGLQLFAEHRFSRGFSFTASYTYSKALDYSSNNGSIEEMNGGSSAPDPFNAHAFYGPSDFNRSQVFVGSFIWSLPGFRSGGAVLSGLTRDWNATGIVTAETGLPFTVTASSDQAACNDCSPHADAIGPLAFSGGRSQGQQLSEYFNVANVAAGAPGTFGNIGRNSLTGPGLVNVDLSVYREFPLPLREGMSMQFRAEAFNLFNHPNFANPNSQFGSSQLGRITSTLGDPRIMQFAVKFVF